MSTQSKLFSAMMLQDTINLCWYNSFDIDLAFFNWILFMKYYLWLRRAISACSVISVLTDQNLIDFCFDRLPILLLKNGKCSAFLNQILNYLRNKYSL